MIYNKILMSLSICFVLCLGVNDVHAFTYGNTLKPLPRTEPQDITLQVSMVNNFPQGVDFQIYSPNLNSLTDIKLIYKVKGQTNKTGYRNSDTTGTDSTVISIESQRAGTYIPPGTTIIYSVEAWTERGTVIKTEEQSFVYLDPSFSWDSIQNESVTVYYHDSQSRGKAEITLETAEETAEFALPIFGHVPKEQFHLVIYTDYSDMEKILPFRSAATASNLITQGIAFTEERTAVIFAGSRNLKSTTSHEFMHLLLHDAVGRFHTRLPAWLDEGLAEYGNRFNANDYASPLEKAIRNGTDKPIKFLNTFSGSPNDIIVAYGKGHAVVTYLADRYGDNSFEELISNFKIVMNIDSALQSTYGLTTDQLESEWSKARSGLSSVGSDMSTEPSIDLELDTPPDISPRPTIPNSRTETLQQKTFCAPSSNPQPLDLAGVLLIIAPLLMFFRKAD